MYKFAADFENEVVCSRRTLNNKLKILVFILVVIATSVSAFSQNSNSSKKSAIDSDVVYSAEDSIVVMEDGTAFLYGKASVSYQNINLKSGFIRLNIDSNLVYACGIKDTLGNFKEFPVFKEGNDSYESKALSYNFKTKKGLIYGTITQQGEGYVTSGMTKKLESDIFCLKDGKYTTCDQHDHPHFYLNLTEAKMKQGKYIVTGPAYLVVEDVPLPLVLPFAYFPFPKNYSSGILFPTFGDELSRGFYAKNGGYYFAVNDYFDLALTGDIYTKGSWALTSASSYKVRYKFSGSFNMSFIQNILGEKDLPDYSKNNDFSIMWSHSQDTKSSPYSSLSASVNFATSSYERNNLNSYYNANLLSQNTKSSTVTYTQRFPESPFSISASIYANQRTKDSTISLSLPNLNVNMSRIYPLKRKSVVGNERWYEKINMTYTGKFANSITTKESELLGASFTKDWKNGVQHSIPISVSFNILKYFTLTPSVNSNLRWYFSRIDQKWQGDYSTGGVVADTTKGFYNVFDYTAAVSLQTKLYGFFKPSEKIFGDKVQMIRHVITPSISLSYKPDYGTQDWGYWGEYDKPYSDGSVDKVVYNRFQGQLYGTPSIGKAGTVTMSLASNLEMKVKSSKDSLKQFSKISLIDNLSFSTGYNLIADSLNWSNISSNLRMKFHKDFTLNMNFVFDPYTYQLNKSGSPVRVNVSQLEKNGVLGRLMSTGTSFGYTFNNKTFSKKKDVATTATTTNPSAPKETENKSLLEKQIEELNPLEKNKQKKVEDEYKKFVMPWSLRFDYNMRYAYSDFNTSQMEYNRKMSHDISAIGSVNLTENWSFNFSTYYNINTGEWSYVNCAISRDLHCWKMSASFVPVGLYKSYNFVIGIKSSLLKDLKYEKHSSPYDNQVWY